ncbi:hypothetical protein [uncultured Cyclobacterium sp.]|uniref:hypothetical protein n=1 Tax=uncultured Cyclobacterium sp. TaxID=453820 RepID=UPI0030EC0E5E|tara:strand:+ start:268834 stop:269130 length:297 start_codon:yes stop_codon:yes gene_type:complete
MVVKLQVVQYSYRTDWEYETGSEEVSLDLELLLQDFMDLSNLGLIERNDSTAMIDIADVNPNNRQLSSIGEKYDELTGLKELESDDLFEIIEGLKKSP